jgi:hypothetical protein
VPFESPLIVQLTVAFTVLQDPLDEPPSNALNAVTDVLVIADPLFAGATQVTTTEPLPAV